MNFQKLFSALITFTSIVGSVLLLTGHIFIGLTVWTVGYLTVILRQLRVFRDYSWKHFPNMQVLTRACFTIGVAGPLLNMDQSFVIFSWMAFTLALFFVRVPRAIHEIASGADFQVANLQGIELIDYPQKLVSASTVMLLFLPPVLLLLVFFQSPGWLTFTITLGVGLVLTAGILQSFRWRLSRKNLLPQILVALRELNPRFTVHWSAPENSAYQLDMWIPYLNKLDIPYFIIVRNGRTWDEVLKVAGDVPVIRTRSLQQAEDVLTSSLTTIFYVNNADRNSHMVRHSHLKHIQLLHGDSEKASSYNPVTAMFDRIYVAGKAGVDRYSENGIDIPKRKFTVVGRPQVSSVKVDNSHIRTKQAQTVLYAPTWNGFFKDTAYSSLPIVEPLISELLQRGVRIIFRPHPYSYQDPELGQCVTRINKMLAADFERTNTQHIWGEAASQDLTVYDCFNKADALIADVSSVITDFLFSGKPIGIMTGEASKAEVIGTWKLANAAYIFPNSPTTWPEQLDLLLSQDPLQPKRQEMRTYYLGDIPQDKYIQQFLSVAEEDILRAPKVLQK